MNGYNPEQLQLLSVRQFTTIEVSQILGLPPSKLGDMSHEASRSLSESYRDYYGTSLSPIATDIEDEITRKLIREHDCFVQHDMNVLVRESDYQRAQTNEIRMRNGVLLINEWRAEDGRNPFDQDGRVLPLNMQIVSDADIDLDPNPDEGDPVTEPEPEGPQDQPDPMVIASREVVRDAIGKITRREAKNLRRHQSDGKVDPTWLQRFYAKEAKVWVDALSPSLALYSVARNKSVSAEDVVARAIERSREAVLGAVDLDTLLPQWERTRTKELIAGIEEGC